jgi:SAM-dependent methyltransferase
MSGCWRKDRETYARHEIHCAPGLHAAAAAMLARHNVARSGVMDLGAGTGAFLARLSDQGYSDLHAVERDADKVKVAGVTVTPLDLETQFAATLGRRFALVTAIEVIEHLDSPIRFLRQAALALEPGGHLLLSTPNLSEWKSRVKFLLRGEMRYFDVHQYNYQRHISPVLPGLVPSLLKEAGLELVEQSAAGTFDGWLKRVITWPAATILGSPAPCECLLVLARKTK